MTAGYLFPFSATAEDEPNVFPNHHNSEEAGLGVAASLGSDAVWALRFQAPPTLPAGTAKLRLLALATTSGPDTSAQVNPKWVSVAVGENPTTLARNAEGTTTLTWTSGDSDEYKEAIITLDADTIVVDEMIAMDLTFETSGWTLAVVSTWIAAIFWE